ncbi:unnamed protein product [Effrenium voratum]|nr:unnamed protein product [Effrenium voratum]
MHPGNFDTLRTSTHAPRIARCPATMAKLALVALLSWSCAGPAGSVELEWLSYSDRADLPMSQRWREEMQAKLSKVDTSKLSPEQKRKFKELWRRVGDHPDQGDAALPVSAGAVAVAALLAWLWYAKPWSNLNASPSAQGVQGFAGAPGGDPARAEELRQLRMRRFATAPPSAD